MKKEIIIIGAGEAGKMICFEIQNKFPLYEKYEIVGFLDDNEKLDVVNHIPVLGKIQDASSIIKGRNIDEALIAIPSASKELISSIVDILSPLGISIKIVPGLFEIISGNVEWNQIRKIKPEDLLGREEVGFDLDKIYQYFEERTVFITGAGGSIGSEILRHLFQLPVKKIIAFGHGENSIYNLIEAHRNNPKFHYVIGDIKDYDKLLFELNRAKPDIVFHAAAHKHLPLMEDYPDEAVKNNIIGTYNTAKAAISANVSNFILISTDKAVNPTSVMGATKRIAEKIVLSLNKFQDSTRFSVVRFGNVLGSRGSVIPAFMKQIKQGGPVLLTDPNIERFVMSIPEAARLVIKALTLTNGEIFILDMGRAIKIIDLAKNLIKLSGHTEYEIPITITGLRKGEKLYEELFYSNIVTPSSFEKILISKESHDTLSQKNLDTMMQNFLQVANSFDSNKVKNLLKKYVPEYRYLAVIDKE